MICFPILFQAIQRLLPRDADVVCLSAIAPVAHFKIFFISTVSYEINSLYLAEGDEILDLCVLSSLKFASKKKSVGFIAWASLQSLDLCSILNIASS